eukprot:11561904-Heterocapsa_arctica.AAC.1
MLLRFVGVRRGPPLSPSDSQQAFYPERFNGSPKTLTNNKTNKTDHSRCHHHIRNGMLSHNCKTDHNKT